MPRRFVRGSVVALTYFAGFRKHPVCPKPRRRECLCTSVIFKTRFNLDVFVHSQTWNLVQNSHAFATRYFLDISVARDYALEQMLLARVFLFLWQSATRIETEGSTGGYKSHKIFGWICRVVDLIFSLPMAYKGFVAAALTLATLSNGEQSLNAHFWENEELIHFFSSQAPEPACGLRRR